MVYTSLVTILYILYSNYRGIYILCRHTTIRCKIGPFTRCCLCFCEVLRLKTTLISNTFFFYIRVPKACGWTCQGRGVSDLASARRQEGTRANEGSSIVYITENLVRHHAQNTTYELFVGASLFRLTGWFHINLFIFFSSQVPSQSPSDLSFS